MRTRCRVLFFSHCIQRGLFFLIPQRSKVSCKLVVCYPFLKSPRAHIVNQRLLRYQVRCKRVSFPVITTVLIGAEPSETFTGVIFWSSLPNKKSISFQWALTTVKKKKRSSWAAWIQVWFGLRSAGPSIAPICQWLSRDYSMDLSLSLSCWRDDRIRRATSLTRI